METEPSPADDEEPEEEEPPPSAASRAALPAGGRRFVDPRAAEGRIAFAVAAGLVATFLTPAGLPLRLRAVAGWDMGALVFAVLAWLAIARASPASTRARAAVEDPGRRLVFVLAFGASTFSLFAAVVVLRELKSFPGAQAAAWSTLALLAVVLSWVVTHTAFTLRYAHLYYLRHAKTRCLQFPGDHEPSDLDFAYFAFTIGMCFQVSDVTVVTSRARRAVLAHAFVSFVYNTMIVALALNLVMTLLG